MNFISDRMNNPQKIPLLPFYNPLCSMNLQDSLSEERLADGSNDDSENLSTAASTIHQKVDATIEA